jgi:hypothetical protein
MKEREELALILNLIRKYNLPLSPILEYAIKEKMEEFPVEEQLTAIDNNKKAENDSVVNEKVVSKDLSVESLSDELRIVDYGERTIAVVGDTKPHKDALKSIGGYFVFRTQWGPAWVFRDKKRHLPKESPVWSDDDHLSNNRKVPEETWGNSNNNHPV